MINIPEQSLDSRKISLKDKEGNLLSATVELGVKDWYENSYRFTECRIKLTWSGGEIECIDVHFFESFKRVREKLAKQDIYPMCYGASRKVVITGMAAEMGLGLKVYKAEIGGFPSRKQLVSIFDYGEDVEPVTVEVQEEFQQQWAISMMSSVGWVSDSVTQQ